MYILSANAPDVWGMLAIALFYTCGRLSSGLRAIIDHVYKSDASYFPRAVQTINFLLKYVKKIVIFQEKNCLYSLTISNKFDILLLPNRWSKSVALSANF